MKYRYTQEDVGRIIEQNDKKWIKASEVRMVVQQDEFGNFNVLPILMVEQTNLGIVIKVG